VESWAQSGSLPAGDVFHARTILALAEGLTYREIEQKLGASAPAVAKWRIVSSNRGWKDSRVGIKGATTTGDTSRTGARDPTRATEASSRGRLRERGQAPTAR